VLYVFHFVLVLDLRKSAVLPDFAVRFLFSLSDFCVLSSDLGVGTKFPWLGLVSCTLDFLTHGDFSSGLLLGPSSHTRICALVVAAVLFSSQDFFLAHVLPRFVLLQANSCPAGFLHLLVLCVSFLATSDFLRAALQIRAQAPVVGSRFSSLAPETLFPTRLGVSATENQFFPFVFLHVALPFIPAAGLRCCTAAARATPRSDFLWRSVLSLDFSASV
jgi:hypothetical protein